MIRYQSRPENLHEKEDNYVPRFSVYKLELAIIEIIRALIKIYSKFGVSIFRRFSIWADDTFYSHCGGWRLERYDVFFHSFFYSALVMTP
jgi:hypothetical protein